VTATAHPTVGSRHPPHRRICSFLLPEEFAHVSPSPTADLPSDRTRRPSSRRYRLEHLRRLTARDRLLLSWLAEHYVLTTTQISRALFPSERSARLRLATLAGIEAVRPVSRDGFL
jgi:Replication-relaxation